MSFSKDKIRQLMSKVGKKGSNEYWNPPKDGTVAEIRMFAYPYGDDPFLDYWFHFNINNESILCPKQNGHAKTCKVCELASELFNSGNVQDKEISKKIFARQRFYAPVVARSDESLSPKYWGFSQTIYLKLLSWLEDKDRQDFLDPETGLDLVISVAQTPGKQFKETQVDTRLRSTALGTKEQIITVFKSLKRAEEVFVCLSDEQVQEKLDKWAGATSFNPEELEVEKAGKNDDKKNTKKSEEDIDALFDQLQP